VGESRSLLIAAQATAARLRAEVNGTPLVFPEIVAQDPKLVHEETACMNHAEPILNKRFQV
jgi:adhesin transport system membrane fusion protein